MDKNEFNNFTTVSGIVNTMPKYNHEIYGEKFYAFELAVKRKSGVFDTIDTLVSERLCSIGEINIGSNVNIEGQFRSHNNQSGEGNRLMLYIFAKEITVIDQESSAVFENCISLRGFVCKPVIYRETPLGREIADILLAVNRSFNKSDYIPCIAWGRNAKFASKLPVGTKISLEGRIQSREYVKVSDGDELKRTAYEVSVIRIESIE